MKKLLLLLVILLVLAVLSIYLLIPGTITISKIVPVKCNAAGAFPFFSSERKWAYWWPVRAGGGMGADTGRGKGGDMVSGMGADTVLTYNGYRYQLTGLSYYNADVHITGQGVELTGKVIVVPAGVKDSTLLQWVCRGEPGRGPFQRLMYYRKMEQISGDLDNILRSAALYLGKEENIYGVSIREGSTIDSHLVAIRSELSSYPSTGDIYALVDKARRYIVRSGAQQAGFPMVNASVADSTGRWKITVAVPVDRPLKNEGGFYYMRLVPGKYLIADVKGGEGAIQRAMDGLRDYIKDYQRTVMAIPFQSMVTDRMAEPDSAQWKTRIYYPVF